MTHGLVFDTAAADYETGRPGYPDEVFDLLTARCGLTSGADVLEIGAGPGQATEPLLDAGARVIAVEPGANFARRLAERFSGLTVVCERFEQVELAGATFDLVVSATAFHWVDHEVGLPKIHGCLRPGGWVALVWNHFADPDADVPFPEAVQPLMDRWFPDYQGSLSSRGHAPPWLERLTDAGFVDVAEHRWPWRRTETTEQTVARFLTHSGPLGLAAVERTRFAGELREVCDGQFEGRIEQAYVTLARIGRRPPTAR